MTRIKKTRDLSFFLRVFFIVGVFRKTIFYDFEGTVFEIGLFRRSVKITPIDSPRRELQIRYLVVKNGSVLIVLRRVEVGRFSVRFCPVVFSPRFFYPRFFYFSHPSKKVIRFTN